MADEPKPSWWKSIPGTLTAATGFIAALSGLVAGLNQLGLFKPAQPAPVVVQMPQPPGTTVPDSTAIATGKPPVVASGGATSTSPSSAGAAPTPGPATPRSPSSEAARPGPAPAPPKPSPAAALPDSAMADQPRLAKGTTFDLTVPARTCAPASGQERFTARLVGAVKAGAATLPANSSAFLRLRRDGAAGAEARLDSLVGPGLAGAVSSASVRIVSGAGGGGCLRPGARLIARLDAPVSFQRR